jgi:Protein of unknown function (DUF5818)
MEENMEKVSLTALALMVLCGLSFAAPQGGKQKAFTGVIMDGQCAMMGSHEKMEKMHPKMFAKSSSALTGPEARKCTLACVKMGGKFVLYNPKTKRTYQLPDQEKPREFAGEKVKVTGTYDKATKTIHVERIEAAS